jgi:serine/threonine-protein kinase HipA
MAYVTRRFDRRLDGSKRAMEDFCQLAELPPSQKYEGTAERCGKLLRRFASEPLIALRDLYRVFVFNWWVGNGDLHLKNLAVVRDDDGRIVLSPAFDQLNTRLVIPDDVLALTVDGKRDRLKTASWERLAESFGIGVRAAARIRQEIAASLPRAVELVRASPLPRNMQDAYVELLEQRLPVTREER